MPRYRRDSLSLKLFHRERCCGEDANVPRQRNAQQQGEDLYDLYVLAKLVEKNDVALKEAFKETCRCRRFEIDKNKVRKTLESVLSSPMQRKVWGFFSKKMSYAKEITFDDVIKPIGQLIEIML